MTSLESAVDQLLGLQSKQEWIPEIPYPCPDSMKELLRAFMLVGPGDVIDLVKLVSLPRSVANDLRLQLGLPEGAIFKFTEFVGPEASPNLSSTIVQSAAAGHTSLVRRSTHSKARTK